MQIQEYIESVGRRYALGNATEHTFRGDLQQLIETLVPEIHATNEPKRIECGAPDYVITRKDIPVGYIEAKDIGFDLESKNVKEQFDRYRDALDNLVFTDYLDFRFYLNGEKTTSVRIAEVRNGKVVPLPEQFEQFTNLIREFASRTPQTIKSSKKLAEMMAEKAKILAFIIKNALDEDIAAGVESDLTNQMKAFKDILIHDIDPKAFADIYAQTIAYGMFAARLHDKELDTFSRQEAAEKIPKTNPFLRKLFQFIAAFDLDTRIDWIVDALADLFRATDIAAILKNFGKSTQTHDPIMHFYETFLAEYDPKLRKSRGVFYTPEPVVDFIVRAVDDILKTEFNLPQGLADTSKTKVKVDVQGKLREQEVHKVQILDPATGTGTFLASVIKHIYKRFEGQQGIWGDYLDNHLIPRLNGFELLMASYAMAHLKLDLLLTETGYTSVKDKRFQVYLTNALEEYHPDTGTLFASWLSTEANEANHIKRDTPVMVVIGNPPYSGESSNKGKWIMDLMEDYKREPDTVERLKEKNSKWINDDYVKFLRYGQYFIEKNGEGILAFINPHGFLDNPTFRGMRWNLLKTYDKIYVLDLHGNTKKNEIAPDGSLDKNVFDIQQGVSINIFIKTAKKGSKELGQIYHSDVFGTREAKYQLLMENTISSLPFKPVVNSSPYYFFLNKDLGVQAEYNDGFEMAELCSVNGSGVVTKRDNLCIGNTIDYCFSAANDIVTLPKDEFYRKYDLPEDVRDWRYEWAKNDIVEHGLSRDLVRPINYRLFDSRFIYYTGRSRGFMGWPVVKVMSHFFSGDNVGLTLCKQFKTGDQYVHTFVTDRLIESSYVSNRTSEITYVFPLYLYPDSNQSTLDGRQGRVPNLNVEIVDKIAERLGLTFTEEKQEAGGTFAPIDILDYIYAVLHSPGYREKYKEFLKIDFPRVPYPKDAATFWKLVALGGELRQIHLLESPTVERFITKFPANGDRIVEKPEYRNGNVYFNATEYFEGVPEIAWNFYIGGYQPAQKWLKDRKGRTLNYDDINHYQKIIVALTETDRIMKEIDKIELI